MDSAYEMTQDMKQQGYSSKTYFVTSMASLIALSKSSAGEFALA